MSAVAHFRGGPLDDRMQEVEGRTFEIARNLGIDHNPPHEMLIEKGTYERSYRIGEGNYVYVWKGWK